MELIYEPLEDFSEEEIKQALERNNLEELIVLPLAVGQNEAATTHAFAT